MPAAVPFDRVGRYAVRRRIGSGSFATVWLGYDAQLDSAVAIKVLADNWTLDDQVRRRFVEEGRFLRRVDSPHVVSVHDAGELEDGRPYLVMTYADQGSLADRLPDGLPPGQALAVVRQVADGLQALHDRDVLHRDVKPGNVLFKTSGPGARAMLGDLGLGKSLDLSSRLTVVAGTPLFVAPEQAAAESPDARADQYSLAALAFLLLAGEPPYDHGSLQAAADPGPAPSLPEGFGAEADAVVRRALARDPEERWPSVTAFADALVGALPEVRLEPVAAVPGSSPVEPVETQPSPDPGPSTVDHAPPTARFAPAAQVEPLEPVDTSPPPEAAIGSVDDSPPMPPRRRWLRWTVAAVVAVLVGGVAGWAVERRLAGDRTIDDVEGALSVTVPDGWDRFVARDGWQPPAGAGDATSYPALSVGTRSGWATHAGQGVFVGLLPGTRLPVKVPQHPECRASGEPLPDRTAAGEQMVTVSFTGCPGVVVERVVQVTENRLLWVQIKADSPVTANTVLDDVHVHGL
ncbi:serine/threonine-protein kinase [Nocardioides sp. CER19]|uniref:serine/threonine-protein kinase n=1 Tax=Nocardioides sp. CER19 TaxID=3038538 RepID=UPI0024483758|nr:serine/threonine-protein kinase [Nocardioides sp. CER19]MDH2413161.1 protein kinase [Nocardioides sp. CER19]